MEGVFFGKKKQEHKMFTSRNFVLYQGLWLFEMVELPRNREMVGVRSTHIYSFMTY